MTTTLHPPDRTQAPGTAGVVRLSMHQFRYDLRALLRNPCASG